jgi:ADP-ribose pyrophosphatase YjhB (NUDIX family)
MITCTFENGTHASLRHVVVHAIVEKDGALLLEKRAGPILETGKWGLPSGYLNRDETAGEGMLRELFEETGWTGKIISLFRVNSRPGRPKEDRQNISLDFLIKPIEKIGVPDHESSKVEWIPIEKLFPLDEFAFDHGESIGHYLRYRKNKFVLPLIDR